ncbi:MAG: enoyl-CoA hydratase-related protein [Ilumatobacteraceae bacterium]
MTAAEVSSTGAFEFLRTEVRDRVLIVALDRAPVNAVHVPMYDEIRELFSHIDDLFPAANAVVLTSSGRHFCAGNDLDEFMSMDSDNARIRMFHVREAFAAIQDCAVPVIGAVRGAALGTGMALAASCDFVVAADDARFGLPEITVGVMGGARHLARLAPQPMVRRMFFTGDPIGAAELMSVGGVAAVVEGDRLLDCALGYAERIASHSPTALRVAKHTLNVIESMDLQPGYQYEQGWTGWMSDHPDSKEAIEATRESRPPAYATAAFARPTPGTVR